jgi:hypothetical protein
MRNSGHVGGVVVAIVNYKHDGIFFVRVIAVWKMDEEASRDIFNREGLLLVGLRLRSGSLDNGNG